MLHCICTIYTQQCIAYRQIIFLVKVSKKKAGPFLLKTATALKLLQNSKNIAFKNLIPTPLTLVKSNILDRVDDC